MANYYGSARTNYFHVKDGKAFEEELGAINGVVVENDIAGRFCLLCDDETGNFPSWQYDEKNEDEIEIDVSEMVAPHLKDGEVAIFIEVGAEKLRYLNGYAYAVNNKGEQQVLNLSSIYEMANDLTDRPDDITRAEY